MVNVGINIRYIGSYKLRLWVFISFSVDLICITTFFYTSTGGTRWEYHSAAWLNHESNQHFSGHDPIRSSNHHFSGQETFVFIPSAWLPCFFTNFCQSTSEKKKHPKHLQFVSHEMIQSGWVHQLDAAGKLRTIEMLKLGARWHTFSMSYRKNTPPN